MTYLTLEEIFRVRRSVWSVRTRAHCPRLRVSSSHLTPRWREMDSNHRSPVRRAAVLSLPPSPSRGGRCRRGGYGPGGDRRPDRALAWRSCATSERERRLPKAINLGFPNLVNLRMPSRAFPSFALIIFWHRREVVHIQDVSSPIPITKGIFAPTRRGGDLRRHPRNQPSRCPRWAWFSGEVSRGYTNLDRGDLRSYKTRHERWARSYRWRTLR